MKDVHKESLDARASEILRHTVEVYIETGSPVGSKTLADRLETRLSPATIRAVMGHLEDLGLLLSPHTSAGRIPTLEGLRLFVDEIMVYEHLNLQDRHHLDQVPQSGDSWVQIFEKVTLTLADLAQCAGLITANQAQITFKYVEFVRLNPTRAMVVLINEYGMVENRMIDIPADLPDERLEEATNYLNTYIVGKTLQQARLSIEWDLQNKKNRVNDLVAQIVQKGLGEKVTEEKRSPFVVRGQSHLLRHVRPGDELSRLQDLLAALETQEELLSLLNEVIAAQGIQVFIGQNKGPLDLAGCAVIMAPYHDTHGTVIGAIGVVGPVRMSYGRVVPLVNYTAKLIGRIMG